MAKKVWKIDESLKCDNSKDIRETHVMSYEGAMAISESKKDKNYMLKEGQDEDDNKTKSTWIDAIHSLTTGNFTTYTSKELRGDDQKNTGVFSWTYPYDKPLLTHHNQYSGEPIGRVVLASFKTKTKSGLPGIRLKVKVLCSEAKEKVDDGRYNTVSIGGHAEKAICSICGTDLLSEGFCEHRPGRSYDGETCTVVLGDISFIEVSFVNVPADSHAMVVNMAKDFEGTSNENYKNDFDCGCKKENKSNQGYINTKEEQGGAEMSDILQEKVATLNESVELKKQKIETLESKLHKKEVTIEENLQTIDNLNDKKGILENSLQEKDDEIQSLQEENQELRAHKHSTLAEQVVTKKIKLGKVKETQRKNLIDSYIKRTTESLKDTLEDLEIEENLNQEESYDPSQSSEGVDNPGLVKEGNNVEIEDEDKDVKSNVEQRLKSL